MKSTSGFTSDEGADCLVTSKTAGQVPALEPNRTPPGSTQTLVIAIEILSLYPLNRQQSLDSNHVIVAAYSEWYLRAINGEDLEVLQKKFLRNEYTHFNITIFF